MKICHRDNGFVEIMLTEFVEKHFTYRICKELHKHVLYMMNMLKVDKNYYNFYRDMTCPSSYQPYRRKHHNMEYLYFSINVPNKAVGAILATSFVHKIRELFNEKS